MNTLEKKEGVFYTQYVDGLPIEERVFFREGKGVSATSEYYRIATPQEVEAWQQWQKEQEEKIN